jgi:dTDP-4-dehydrorhamnose 3,5-epimerase
MRRCRSHVDPFDKSPRGTSEAYPNAAGMALTKKATTFDDAFLFIPDVYEDDRGYFKETYSTRKYHELGLSDDFVQDSVSFSSRNVIRGLHGDPEMSKLVQCLRGRIFDVLVDLRKRSNTYRKWEAFYLSEHNHMQLYVPAGFAHGFLALTDDVVFSYKHGALHNPEREFTVRWDDPSLGIAWPLVGEPRISAKDRAAPLLEP